MRLAIIDLGTNSVRFDIYEIISREQIERIHREKLMIRLGQEVFLNGKLNATAVERTLMAFQSFKETIDTLHVDRIIAFGTSVLRDATDAHKLINKISKKTGIKLRVISGNEEALLISKGVLAHETRARGRFALVDIGGGSVEISLCVGKRVLYSASYDLGVARLQQVFLKTIPPKPAVKGTLDPVQQLRRYIRGVLTYNLPPGKWPRVQKIIGSSGTANALARIFKKIYGHNGSFSKSYVTKLVEQMRDSSIQSLLKTPGMESKRVDLILAGAILLEEIMQVLCADKVFSTDCSLRDGILEEELKNFHSRKKSPGTFHLQDAYQYAQHLGADMHHADQVAKLSLRLFDSLKRLHKLKPKWKKYLSEAAYLHDTGKGITPVNHALHSFYIVSNAHFASMDDWEKEFVAHLCLMHTAGKVTAKNLPFWREKNKRQAFLKLLSILRIADALDRQHRSLVRIDKVTFQPQFVTLKIIGKDPINLELLGVEQKKELFEKLFSRVLIVEEHF